MNNFLIALAGVLMGGCLYHACKNDPASDRWDWVAVIVIGLVVATIIALIKEAMA